MNELGTKIIETKRLILRKFSMEDADDMYVWASDHDVTKYLTWQSHQNINVTKDLLNEWIKEYINGDCFNWAMEQKSTGRVIGSITVVRLNKDIEACDIGYCMRKDCWGQAFMPEGLEAVLDYLFDQVGLNRIAACHDTNNPKSGRVMEKVGMKKEGILRQSGRTNDGRATDLVWYSTVRSDREK